MQTQWVPAVAHASLMHTKDDCQHGTSGNMGAKRDKEWRKKERKKEGTTGEAEEEESSSGLESAPLDRAIILDLRGIAPRAEKEKKEEEKEGKRPRFEIRSNSSKIFCS